MQRMPAADFSMQPKSSHDSGDEELNRQQMPSQWPTRRPWSSFQDPSVPHLSVRSGRTQTAPSQLLACSEKVPTLKIPIPTVSRFSGFTLPDDKTITISVIAGPSKGLTHRFTKPLVSVGRSGGGADIEIDDPTLAGLHCAVGVRQDVIRLCDLDSATGIYINDELVQAAVLEHLSEFRVGWSLLLVTVLPKCKVDTTLAGE